MSEVTDGSETVTQAGRSRTVVVSFLGAVVRRMGDWLPIGGSVDLLGETGLDASSVRTAVFRLKKRGWLEAESRAGRRGYALTDAALDALAAGDEVIWHARRPAVLSDGWCVVTFSLPETARARRHQLRSHLSSLGFGNAGSGVWIAPARMRTSAERAIAELELTSFCAVFVGDYVAGQDLADLLRSSWDLDEIDRRYRAFVDTLQPTADRIGTDGPPRGNEAFTTYLGVVDQWRKLPFRDPGLPTELLAADWSGPTATSLFEHLVSSLEKPALKHAAKHWPEG